MWHDPPTKQVEEKGKMMIVNDYFKDFLNPNKIPPKKKKE